MSYLGTTEVGKMYLGTTEIAKAYLGNDLVYENGVAPEPQPLYDSEVEYLQSDSDAYIDTGISGNRPLEIQVGWIHTTYVRYACILGNYTSGGTSDNGWRIYLMTDSKGGINVGSLFLNEATHFNCSANTRYDLTFSSNGITVNGSNVNVAYSGTGNSTHIYLFNRGDNPTSRNINLKIYYCKIYDNGTLVRDFIPVRVGQVGYMYDRVSGTLFGNIGSSNFVIGQDITQ